MGSELDVFRATVAHQRPARILYHFDCTPDLDRRLKAHVGGDGDWFTRYGCFGYRPFWPRRPAGVPAPDYSRYWKDDSIPPGAWINHLGVLEVPGSQYHFTAYVSPLRKASTLAEIEAYPIDDVTALDTSWWADEVVRAHEAGKPAGIFVGHMYENSWQIRGYEPFLEDMIERPAWAHSLLERFFRNNLHLAVEAAKASMLGMGTSGSSTCVGLRMSPPFRPYLSMHSLTRARTSSTDPNGIVVCVPMHPSKLSRVPHRRWISSVSTHSGWTGFRISSPASSISGMIAMTFPSLW